MKIVINCLLFSSLLLMGCVSTSTHNKCLSSLDYAQNQLISVQDHANAAENEINRLQAKVRDYNFCIHKSQEVLDKCEAEISTMGCFLSERQNKWMQQCKVHAWETFKRCQDTFSYFE